MRKTFCIGEKGADQLHSNCLFFFLTRNFHPLAITSAYTVRFVSDLFGNHSVGFLMTQLIYCQYVKEVKVEAIMSFFFFVKKCPKDISEIGMV